tara:strand:+ start:55 stop:426 length:372 start_codon:yes stop_codon:yes gene_type:complete
MIYNFTVNCDNSNPVPYKRTTQKQKFVDKGYKKYVVWKNKVVGDFIKEFKKYPHNLLEKDKKYYVEVVAYYKDKKHGDTDNVAKGINDAIFQKPLNDKYIAGSYNFFYDKENPRVEITIKEDK